MIIGVGDKVFCVGSDLKVGFGKLYLKNGYVGFIEWFDFYKFVIVVVNGFVLGGGFEIVFVVDIIVVLEIVSFGLLEFLVGVVVFGGGVYCFVC